MTGIDLTSKINTEDLQRKALKLLYDNLNNTIDANQAGWAAADATYYSSIGRSAPGFTVEHVAASNFYPGTTPSLINADIDKYPNVVCFAWRAIPRGSSDDTGEHYSITLQVEVMTRSHTSEAEVNARIQRTIDCCHSIIVAHAGDLGYSVAPAPIKSLGDIFVRRQEKSRGDRWYWQGGFLQYIIDKYTDFV